MRIFVGFGYNDRDAWIEQQVFPILRGMGFTVVDGKGLHGQILQPAVQQRLDQSDAAVGFFTLRDGQGDADFNSHIWVRDELVHVNAKGKPIIPIREEGVRLPPGLLGDRQYILLKQQDRLTCIAELAVTLGQRNIRRLKIEPEGDQLRRELHQWRRQPGFTIGFRTRDEDGFETPLRQGRLELVDQAFYLNVSDVPRRTLVEVEGLVNGATQFSSGFVSVDAVQVKVF